MDWEQIWTSIKTFFTNNAWNILIFFAVLIIGIIVVKLFLNFTRKIMSKTRMEKVTQGFLFHIIKFLAYFILILILLSVVGISLTGILTTLSALVLAIGMALQNLITNVANGIVIVTTHMFKKGDYVLIDGVEGSIDDINFLFTTLITVDNKRITIPNSSIINNPVTNFGAKPIRRVDFNFEVAYESDVEQVKKIVTDVMQSNGKVIIDKTRQPFCRLKSLESSSIKFFANCWVDAEDYWDVYYYVMENVFNEFKRNNVSIPYNQLEIRERQDNVVMPVIPQKLQKRVEKVRSRKKMLDLERDDLFEIFTKDKKKKSKKDDKKTKTSKTTKDTKELTLNSHSANNQLKPVMVTETLTDKHANKAENKDNKNVAENKTQPKLNNKKQTKVEDKKPKKVEDKKQPAKNKTTKK